MAGAALAATFARYGEDVVYGGGTVRAIRYDDPAEAGIGPGRNSRRRISFEFRIADRPAVPAQGAAITAADGVWHIKGDHDRDTVTGVWRVTVEQATRGA